MGVVINAFFCASTISAPETKPKHVNHMYSRARGLLQCHLRVIQVKRIIREPGAVCVCEAPREEFRPRQTENIQNGLLAGNKDKTYKRQMYCVSEWLILYNRLWVIDCLIDQVFLWFMASLDPFRKIASNFVDDEMRDRWWGVVDVGGPRVIDWPTNRGGKGERERRREYTKITWIMYSIPADGSCVYTY